MGVSALVLARAGSRGLPGKNTARVGGRPCVEWTIEAAAKWWRNNPANREKEARSGKRHFEVTVELKPTETRAD